MKKVMVFGTFDILHPGHLNFFKQARKYGDYLIVVVARDKTVKKLKGKLPKFNEKQRLEKVKKIADKAVLGYLNRSSKIIERYKPDVVCLGYDQDIGRLKIKPKTVRLKPFKPKIYKSSLISKGDSPPKTRPGKSHK